MASECMLTTIDNPFDPFEQFTSWRLFDLEKGYNSCERLARFVHLADELSDDETNEEIERAIDEVIKYDFLDIYKKVRRSDANNNSSDKETELNLEQNNETEPR